MRDLVNQARDQARKKPCNLGWKIRIKILYPSRISPLLPESLHSLQFFPYDRQDQALTGTDGHLGFICTQGAGVGV